MIPTPLAADPAAVRLVQAALQHMRAVFPDDRARVYVGEVRMVESPTDFVGYTTGGVILISRDLLASDDVSGLAFRLCHIALVRHQRALERLQDRDPRAWNLAVSHQVLGAQQAVGMVPPPHMIIFDDLIGLDAEVSYPHMLERVADIDAGVPLPTRLAQITTAGAGVGAAASPVTDPPFRAPVRDRAIARAR